MSSNKNTIKYYGLLENSNITNSGRINSISDNI